MVKLMVFRVPCRGKSDKASLQDPGRQRVQWHPRPGEEHQQRAEHGELQGQRLLLRHGDLQLQRHPRVSTE